MNIRKIICEEIDSFGWTNTSEAKLVKGMTLCNKHGRGFEIADVDERVVRFYNDSINRNTLPFKLDTIMDKLNDGSLTIC
jgi:hypothetical protein